MKYVARNRIVVPPEGIEFWVDPLDQWWVYAVGAAALVTLGDAHKATGDSIEVPAGEDRSISEMSNAGVSFVRIANANNATPATVSCILIGKAN